MMLIKRTPGATRFLGAPADWNEERDGVCVGLPIKDQKDHNGVNYMISTWEPTEEELERLKSGASVLLWVVGVAHPPVALTVGSVTASPESPE